MINYEERVDRLRDNVEDLQAAVAVWRDAGIPDKTIIVLLHHQTKIAQRDIRTILEGIDSIVERWFTSDEGATQ